MASLNLAIQPIHPYLPAPCCLPTRTSAPAMQPMPRMQTTIPMKCTALYRTSKKNQERSITTGMTKQSRSCQKQRRKIKNISTCKYFALNTRTDSKRGKLGYLIYESTFYQEEVYSSGSSHIRHRVRLPMTIP